MELLASEKGVELLVSEKGAELLVSEREVGLLVSEPKMERPEAVEARTSARAWAWWETEPTFRVVPMARSQSAKQPLRQTP